MIVDCMSDDRGSFRCEAATPGGRAETSCNLTVLPPVTDIDMSEEYKTASAQLQQRPASTDGQVHLELFLYLGTCLC